MRLFNLNTCPSSLWWERYVFEFDTDSLRGVGCVRYGNARDTPTFDADGTTVDFFRIFFEPQNVTTTGRCARCSAWADEPPTGIPIEF